MANKYDFWEFWDRSYGTHDDYVAYERGEKSFIECVLDNWDRSGRERHSENAYRRRTYERDDGILSTLGRVEKRYTREMKSSARAWQNDSDGACEMYYVRTESIYEAYAEYRTEREYW